MRKIFYFTSLLALFMLCSCSSDLNKKIDVTEYKTVIDKIKSSSNRYSEDDYKKASELLDGYAFGIMSGNKTIDVTYKQLLDKAKQKKCRKQK